MKSVFFFEFDDPKLLDENFISFVVGGKADAEFCLEKQVGQKTFVVLVKFFLPYFAEFLTGGEMLGFVDLQQQVFEPFCEETQAGTKYGFFLNDVPYFVLCEEVLVNVCKLVTGFCSLTRIEESMVFVKVIESGTASKVFLAESLSSRKKFAVKRFKKQVLVNIGKVLNEIKILKKLDHPKICKLLNTFEDEKFVYLVFDYISSASLTNLLAKEKKLSENLCKALIKSLLETLSYIHTVGIIHRDLKLEHILLNLESPLDFEVIDFGLSCDSTQTRGKKCGSPGYIAPEILRNEDYGTKVDIFSVGVILFTLLHGTFPFDGNNSKSILDQNKLCRIKVSKKLSQGAKEVIQDLMHPIPSLRPSASEILEHPWFGRLKDIRRTLSNATTPDA